jgi:hypothetical protein
MARTPDDQPDRLKAETMSPYYWNFSASRCKARFPADVYVGPIDFS